MELLELTRVGQVGRKRARKLHDAGIESPADLRDAEKATVLRALDGRRATAETILKNAGREDPSMADIEAPEGGSDGATDTPSADAPGSETGDDQASLGDF